MRKLVFGKGVYEKGKHLSWVNGKMTQGYRRWSSMLKRCYSEEYQSKAKSYVGCTVSPEFLNFQSFMNWAEGQVGYSEDEFQLDKDILVEGNKVYSPSTCCFVPLVINTAMMKPISDLPQGVNFDKKRNSYKATVGMYGKAVQIGRYSTAQEAFAGYKYFKEAYIKQIAIENEDLLDPVVFRTLVNYEIKHYPCI